VQVQVLGSAANGADYEPLPSSVTIPAGSATVAVNVVPIEDVLIEQTERAELLITAGQGYVVGSPSLAIISIVDNDLPVVTVSATDPDASEAGPTSGTVTFSRTGNTDASLTIVFARSGTATSTGSGPQDYASVGQLVTIPVGAASATVAIVPLADNLVEGSETASLAIEPAGRYVIGASSAATVTIADDPAIVRIDASDSAASEAGSQQGVLTIARAGGDVASDLVVNVAIGGTATNNADYVSLGGLVTIPAGQLLLAIPVTPLSDNRVEGPETVVVTLEPRTGPPTYVIDTPAAATATIADDPATVSIAASDPNASEAGIDTGTFTFTRSGGDVSAPLQVLVSRSGTATNGSDYTSLGGATFIVTISANETTATVVITPLPDAVAEPAETVILTVNANASYIVGVSTATVTIADGPPGQP
jgi:hypothetical protein